MGNLASLTLMLGADIRQFQTKMRQAANTMRKTGAQMKSIGKNISMYVTAPIMGMATLSIAAFDKQAQAESKLAAQIRSNGKDVETTLSQYKAFASQLQDITTVGDETTLQLMQMAETMQSSNVEQATQGAIGLSKALGINLQSALKMVVLAQKGEYTMLNRYVPALRYATSESEKAAIVQKLYADGMKIATSEAQNGLGPLKQLQNTVGDLMEEFGGLVAEAIKPMVIWLKKIVEHFQGLSERGKRVIAFFAAFAAGIGPVILALGSVLSVLPAIGAALTALMGPVGIVIAAITGIAAAFIYVYGNWEAFKERLSSWSWLKNAAIDAFITLIKASSYFMNEIAKLFGIDFVSPIVEQLEKLKSPVEDVKTPLKSFGQTFKDVTKEALGALGFLGEGTKKTTDAMVVGFQKVANAARSIGTSITPMKSRTKSQSITSSEQHQLIMPPIQSDEFNKSAESINQKMMQMKQVAESVGNATADVFSNFSNRIIESLNLADHGFQGFVKGMLQTVVKLISMMMAQSIANAIAGATTSATATGPAAIFTQPAFIATAVGGVLSAFAAIPKFAEGGIVPPGFANDTYPALLTSGEMVVPKPIPISSTMRGDENIRITGTLRGSGQDLYGVFDNYGKRRNRIIGQ